MSEPSTLSRPGGREPKDSEAGSSSFPAKLGVVVCVILAVLFLIKPVRSHLNKKQAMESVGIALELSAKYQFDAAMGEIKRALELAPDKFEVQHAAADVLTQMGDARGLAFWQSLLQVSRASLKDRKRFVELAIKVGRLDLASSELATLLKENPNSAELLVLEVRRRLLADDALGAVTLAEPWADQKSEEDAAQFALGLARSRLPGSTNRTDGRRKLVDLAISHGEWQIPSLVELASDPGLNRAELQIVLRNLESKASVNPEDQLRIASLQLRLDPDKRSEIAESLLNLSQTVGSSQLLMIANWLELNGELAMVPKVVPMERAKTNGTLLVVRLQTLAWLGESAEVEAQLADTQVPIDALQRSILRSTIAVKKTPPGDPLPALKDALKLAGTNAGVIANIASHALRLELTNAAVDIYSKLMEFPSHTQAASVEIVRLLSEGYTTRPIRDQLRTLEKQAPAVGLFTMEACYFDLLLRENVAPAREQLSQIAAKNSESLRVRMSLALADLVQNDPKTAMDRIGDDKFAWSRTAPRWQALHVAILGANGKSEEARTAAKSVDIARLRPEEALWVQPWR